MCFCAEKSIESVAIEDLPGLPDEPFAFRKRPFLLRSTVSIRILLNRSNRLRSRVLLLSRIALILESIPHSSNGFDEIAAFTKLFAQGSNMDIDSSFQDNRILA